jgi:hypothetical protein
MPSADQDYLLTRQVFDALDGWLARFVSRERAPVMIFQDDWQYWDFPEHTARTTEIAKAARAVAALRAAMVLADARMTTEASFVLRAASDCASEIIFLCEGAISGTPTTDQKKFVEDFFIRPPRTLDEFLESDKRRFLYRGDIYKAHKRLAERTSGVSPKEQSGLAGFIDALQNEYAHGGYASAMELYDGESRGFETAGIGSDRSVAAVKRAIALKAYYVMVAFVFLATVRGMGEVADDIMRLQRRLELSDDYGNDDPTT